MTSVDYSYRVHVITNANNNGHAFIELISPQGSRFPGSRQHAAAGAGLPVLSAMGWRKRSAHRSDVPILRRSTCVDGVRFPVPL